MCRLTVETSSSVMVGPGEIGGIALVSSSLDERVRVELGVGVGVAVGLDEQVGEWVRVGLGVAVGLGEWVRVGLGDVAVVDTALGESLLRVE
jgi:hypothetical protein